MQSLIAVLAVFITVCTLVYTKNRGFNVVASLRVFVRRLAVYVMSFSWIVVLASIFVLACYSDITGLLKEVLSASSVSGLKSCLKSCLKLIFGVDSAFMALQMLALYSLMVGFVSCLALSIGLTTRFVYKAIMRIVRTSSSDEEINYSVRACHSTPTFKIFQKYNS